jgi:hypothetical protein
MVGRIGSRARVAALACTVLVALSAGCAIVPTPSVPDTTPRPVTSPRADYRVLGGVEQLYVLDALEGDRIDVLSQGVAVATGVADRFGSLAVRELEQGRTYQVRNRTSGDVRDVRILVADEHPSAETYRATRLREGLNYVPMRDGITLAATVRPPIGQSLSDGPFPTVIEYSGYQIAAPNEPLIAKVGSLLGLPSDPLAPGGETDVGSLLVRLAGFAVVSVQMRGTGCSGGESDLFDLPTRLDGYDAVETVAAQPWVKGGTVGMVGISFSGFSQIATAATRPPHLSAIAPMSFVGSLYDIAHPGGIFNDGFARTWMAERVASTRPAPAEGALPYANELVRTDARCRDNQRLRLQTRDGDGLIRSEDTFGVVYQRRDFRAWMRDIQVPTFASLQFEDEETSSYAVLSARDLVGANDRVWLNVSSGHHRDAVTPDTITQFFEFLDIYVARQAPSPKLLVNLVSGIIFGEGSDVPPLPTAMAPTLAEARASFEARPRVRVLLELAEGANEGRNRGAAWQLTDSTFPLSDSVERTWYLGDGGTLTDAAGPPAAASYRPDPAARRRDPGPASVASAAAFEWTAVAPDAGLGFVSSPLTEDVVALGPAALDLRLSSNAADTDVAVVITEVRPDGQEMLVGTGVQRASMRDVDPARSTATVPAFTLVGARPLEGGVAEVPVQVLPMGHVFRAGSRIRVLVTAVNGDRERWTYDSVVPAGRSVTDTIHLGAATPSSITFTLSPRRGYPAASLPCPAAAKPCRPYTPMLNGG